MGLQREAALCGTCGFVAPQFKPRDAKYLTILTVWCAQNYKRYDEDCVRFLIPEHYTARQESGSKTPLLTSMTFHGESTKRS